MIFVVIDGLGDRGDKTPLSEAYKPNLNELASRGMNGLVDVIAPGIVPGSDTGHLALFGYDPFKYYPGRGVFEALGAGLELKEGDIAFRANFATIKDGKIVDRRAGRFGSDELAKELNMEIDGVKVIVKRTTGHRCAVIFRPKEEKLSSKISDCDPKKVGVEAPACQPLDNSEEAKRTAEIVNKFIKEAHRILSDHPINIERRNEGKLEANYILLRGAGEYRKVESFKERWGLKAACVAGGAMYKGVAKYLDFKIIEVKGATADENTDLKAKAEAALKALENHDFVFVHVKATDTFGHDGNFEGKKWMIERIDKELISEFLSCEYITVTSDHSTPVLIKRHSSDPVPIVICGEGVRRDDVDKFDEFSASKGILCRIRGTDIVPIITDLLNKYRMFGT